MAIRERISKAKPRVPTLHDIANMPRGETAKWIAQLYPPAKTYYERIDYRLDILAGRLKKLKLDQDVGLEFDIFELDRLARKAQNEIDDLRDELDELSA